MFPIKNFVHKKNFVKLINCKTEGIDQVWGNCTVKTKLGYTFETKNRRFNSIYFYCQNQNNRANIDNVVIKSLGFIKIKYQRLLFGC